VSAAPLPAFVYLEPTTRCNFACRYCGRKSGDERDHGDVDLEEALFDRLVAQNPFLRHIRLQGLGEPLLYPGLALILEKGSRAGLTFDTVSNGSLLTKERVDLILAHFTHYTVSIDSVDEGLFRELREGPPLRIIVEGLRRLVSARNSGNARTKVGINFTVSHLNARELDIIDSFAVSCGLDYINVMDVSGWTLPGDAGHDESQAFLERSRDDHDNIREKVERLIERSGKGPLEFVSYMESRDFGGLCPLPLTMAYVSARGDVLPCCMFKVICASRRLSMGNLNVEPFEEIWNGGRFRSLRAAIMHGIEDSLWTPLCRTCPY
jgi:MoaA/NifB/PqqE/SkfB family radical SAM enzyme